MEIKNFTLPVKPKNNEDGTYTISFPEITIDDENLALFIQIKVTEFLIHLYTNPNIQYLPINKYGNPDTNKIIKSYKSQTHNQRKENKK